MIEESDSNVEGARDVLADGGMQGAPGNGSSEVRPIAGGDGGDGDPIRCPLSRQRLEQLASPEKSRAREATKSAVNRGELTRSDRCQICGKACYTNGHHYDYSLPLSVCWLCDRCHGVAHRIINGSLREWVTRPQAADGEKASAGRALGSARSERKTRSVRENGKLGASHGIKGGRPTRYLLVDDLGRCVGETRRPGPAGTRVEYGLRTPDAFRAEGHAKLVRPSDWTGHVPDRKWDA